MISWARFAPCKVTQNSEQDFFFFSNGLASLSWFAGLNDEVVNIQHIKLSSLFVLAVISSVMMAGAN